MASVSVCFRSSAHSAHSARSCACGGFSNSVSAARSRSHSQLGPLKGPAPLLRPRVKVWASGDSGEKSSASSSSSSSSSSNESSYSIASFSLDRKTTSTPNELLRVYDADAVNLQKSASLIFTYLILGILLYLTVDLATNPQALRP